MVMVQGGACPHTPVPGGRAGADGALGCRRRWRRENYTFKELQLRQWMTGRRGGFTLVELLVVLTIFVILASLTVPGIVRLMSGARDELGRTAETVFTLMKAARVYAATHRIETAVVYNLDNYVGPDQLPNNDAEIPNPVQDSIMEVPVRVITAAAVMYRLPASDVVRWSGGTRADDNAGYWFPIPRDEGNFSEFPPESVVLLQDPASTDPNTSLVYSRFVPRFTVGSEGGMGTLGMRGIHAWLSEEDLGQTPVDFPAHIFTPGGQLKTFDAKERYVIYVARVPSALPEDRLVVVPNEEPYLQTIPIELYRSTARVRIAEPGRDV